MSLPLQDSVNDFYDQQRREYIKAMRQLFQDPKKLSYPRWVVERRRRSPWLEEWQGYDTVEDVMVPPNSAPIPVRPAKPKKAEPVEAKPEPKLPPFGSRELILD